MANIWILIYPLVPSAANMRRNAKILILILEGIIKKISYERSGYESVDEKNLSYIVYVPKNYEKNNSGSKRIRMG